MEVEDTFVDYYKLLQCDRKATNEELKKSYQRLVLTLHPDKKGDSTDHLRFSLIQKAWTVLRDQESRKQYDAELTCNEHNDLLLYDTISLTDMEFNSAEGAYTYNCRCGGTYLLESSNSMPQNAVIGCDECSFSIQVNL